MQPSSLEIVLGRMSFNHYYYYCRRCYCCCFCHFIQSSGSSKGASDSLNLKGQMASPWLGNTEHSKWHLPTRYIQWKSNSQKTIWAQISNKGKTDAGQPRVAYAHCVLLKKIQVALFWLLIVQERNSTVEEWVYKDKIDWGELKYDISNFLWVVGLGLFLFSFCFFSYSMRLLLFKYKKII